MTHNKICQIMLVMAATLLPIGAGAATETRAKAYPVSAVRLTPSPFRHAQEMDIRYLLGLDPDRLLAPYLKQAGLTPKAENYTNWENTGLDGHIGGHYLSALAYMYAATGNEEIKRRLDYMLSELKRCQEAAGDGYLCGVPNGRKIWDEVSRGDIREGSFNLNGGWVPLYNIHKTYAGLRDAYLLGGSEEALGMLVELTDWMERLTAGLTDAQMQQMLASEHGGLNEVFADVAALTGDKRYLRLAERFSHRTLLDPLKRGEDRLTGMHANTQIPKVVGFKRMADVGGDASLDSAAAFFWDAVTSDRTVSIGGNSVREHFHPSSDFTSMMTSEQGPETCNTYNMLRLSKMLYETSADTRYMDYYERALFNHILSSINPVQGGFVYFTPMRPGHYRVYSQPQTSMWCCVGSGLENPGRYGEAIYARRGVDTICVNLFIPSVLTAGQATVETVTTLPETDSVTFRVTPVTAGSEWALAMRVPSWTEAADVKVKVNSQPVAVSPENGYIVVRREWQAADSVTLTLPMCLKAEQLPDGQNYYSLVYGPTVLAADMGAERQDGLFADDSRGGHIAQGPMKALDALPAIISDTADPAVHLTKDEGEGLTFTLTGVSLPQYEGLKLRPFSQIHERRYMIYFPVYSEAEWQQRCEQLAAEERERASLDAITLDVVICGEQQPESDHFVSMSQSRTGDDNGRHWRMTTDTFGYTMTSRGKEAKKLRVVYRPEEGCDAVVSIDGKTLGRLNSAKGVADFELPRRKGGESVRVSVGKGESPATPHIYEVRLLGE